MIPLNNHKKFNLQSCMQLVSVLCLKKCRLFSYRRTFLGSLCIQIYMDCSIQSDCKWNSLLTIDSPRIGCLRLSCVRVRQSRVSSNTNVVQNEKYLIFGSRKLEFQSTLWTGFQFVPRAKPNSTKRTQNVPIFCREVQQNKKGIFVCFFFSERKRKSFLRKKDQVLSAERQLG